MIAGKPTEMRLADLSNEKFPDMKRLTDYAQQRAEDRLYSSLGPKTCAEHEGS
jgi:hypothetical protein